MISCLLGGEEKQMAKRKGNLIGSWAFTIGVLVAILLGVLGSRLGDSAASWLTLTLFGVGVIVGIMNVTSDEAMGFLTTSAILVFVSFAGGYALASVPGAIAQTMIKVLNALMVLFVPATIVVALRAVFTLARD